jgi:hypothetical protein
MTTAPFSQDVIRVPRRDRGYAYAGQTLGSRADSLTYHLTKRVVIEQQWTPGTTAADYVRDLQQAVQRPGARLAVYAYGPDYRAATLTTTSAVVPSSRFGPRPEAYLLVVYSAARGALVTGYQVSSLAKTAIPAGAQWLQ